MNTRTQLTIFATGPVAERIEEVRRRLDPIQFHLIAAHVTLCREDELEGLSLETIRSRLSTPAARPLTLTFGAPSSFSTHGFLLPCIAGEEHFQTLRQVVLLSATVRRAAPHITLAHPRNPKSAENSLAAAASLGAGAQVRFESVCLIQQDGASPWRVRQRFPLPGAVASDA